MRGSRRLLILVTGAAFVLGAVGGAAAYRSGAVSLLKANLFGSSPPDYQPPDLPDELVEGTGALRFRESAIETPKAFLAWRTSLVRELERFAAVEWCCQEYARRSSEVSAHEGFTRERVVLASADDELDPVFYRLVPDSVREGGAQAPGVLVIPGSGGGVRGALTEGTDYQQGIASSLARAGFVVYAIENLGWGERDIDPGTTDARPSDALALNSLLVGRPLAARYVLDARRVLLELTQDELVDPDRIGVVGISLGGNIATFVSALEGDRVSATVIASGISRLAYTPGPSQFILPGMNSRFDVVDVGASIAPRPVLLSYGAEEESPVYRQEYDTTYTYGLLQAAWDVFGSSKSLVLNLHQGGHTYDVPATLNFLHRHLKGTLTP